MHRERLKIGVSACFLYPDPQRNAFAKKTLQYIEQSVPHWVMSGGEDHAMLACFPPEATLPEEFRPIGRVHAAPCAGVAAGGVLLDGLAWGGPRGWVHYQR